MSFFTLNQICFGGAGIWLVGKTRWFHVVYNQIFLEQPSKKNSSLNIKVSGPFLSGGYGKSDPAGGGRIGSAKMWCPLLSLKGIRGAVRVVKVVVGGEGDGWKIIWALVSDLQPPFMSYEKAIWKGNNPT